MIKALLIFSAIAVASILSSCASSIPLRKQPSDIVFTSLNKVNTDISYSYKSQVTDPIVKTQGINKLEFNVSESFKSQLKEVMEFKYNQNPKSKNQV